MLSCDVEEIQQKIKGAIDRNDFKSARHMFDKYRCSMPSRACLKNVNMPNRRVFCPLDGAIFP